MQTNNPKKVPYFPTTLCIEFGSKSNIDNKNIIVKEKAKQKVINSFTFFTLINIKIHPITVDMPATKDNKKGIKKLLYILNI